MKVFPSKSQTKNRKGEHTGYEYEKGMDLRDYFAAKAMQPVYNSLEEASGSMLSTIADTYNLGDSFRFEEIVAVMSYELADAMMEARNARTD